MTTAHDQAHEAARKAVTAWIAEGDAKSGRDLIAALVALASAGSTKIDMKERALSTKRRKVQGAARGRPPKDVGLMA